MPPALFLCNGYQRMTFPFGWRRRAQLTINATAVAGSGGELTDFPVLLRAQDLPVELLDPDAPVPAQADGGDIRMTADKAGAQLLETEIFLWDQAARKVIIWVKAPSLAQDLDTPLWVWWGSDETEALPAATVRDTVLSANAQPEQAWAGHFDYLRRDPRSLRDAVSASPQLILDLKRLEATQADGSRVALSALPGFSYTRTGRTTVYRDGETRIVEADAIPVGDTGYAPQSAATQMLTNDPLDLTTGVGVGATKTDLGPFQIFRRVSIESDGFSSNRLIMDTFAATAGQSFSVQWYLQPGSSGQAFCEVINMDSLAAGRLRGPIGDMELTEDAGFGTVSNIRMERLAEDVWRVSAVVTPAETASYRIGLGPNSGTAGEDIIGLAMGAQDEVVATALIPDASAARGSDDMRAASLSGLEAGTMAVSGCVEPFQIANFPRAAELSNGTGDEVVRTRLDVFAGTFGSGVVVGGSLAGEITGEGPWTGCEIGVRTWIGGGTHHWADSANGEGSTTSDVPTGLDTLSVGSERGFTHVLGEVAWVALWDTALGETDVKRLRVPGRALAALGLVGGGAVGGIARVHLPTADSQAALELEYWDAGGERISADIAAGAIGTGGEISVIGRIPSGGASLRLRAVDQAGSSDGYLLGSDLT